MAFGFNLFMPFREYGGSALDPLLGRCIGFPVRVVGLGFEFHGPTDVLAECAGPKPTDDEKFTASDVAVHLRDESGRAGVVLVEVKLSEGGFTPCNGARSEWNRRKDVCGSGATFFQDPRACYLRRTRHAQRDRRYWDIFDAAFGSVEASVPGYTGERCPFRDDYQQLMRNHALALGLVQAGEVDFTGFGLVHTRTTIMWSSRGRSTALWWPTHRRSFVFPPTKSSTRRPGRAVRGWTGRSTCGNATCWQ